MKQTTCITIVGPAPCAIGIFLEYASTRHEEGLELIASGDEDQMHPQQSLHGHDGHEVECTHARVSSAESDETLANLAQDDGDAFWDRKDAGLPRASENRNGNGPLRT
jgi:hypothetical protein